MIEVETFVMISAMVHFVLVIVLGGILIAEYYKTNKKFKKGILRYEAFLIVILTFFVLEVYRTLITSSIPVNWICLFLAILANILFVSTSLKYWKHINRKLFFVIPPFAIGIIVIEVLRLLQVGKYLEIYTAMTTLVATIFAYFIILSFLINISGKKK